MRRTWTVGGVVAGLTLVGAVMPAQAHAAVPPASATVGTVSKVTLVDGVPVVSGTYTCTGRLSHLWVSAKQGPGDLSQEGSGAQARAWWQRTKDNKLDCDGNQHNVTVRLQRTGDSGRLFPNGRDAWVQFCLLTGNTPDDFDENGDGAFASNQKYRDVKTLR